MENPVGFRFRPTDEEIVNHYLRPKNLDDDTSHVDEVINTVDICSLDPWELPSKSMMKSRDMVWYFFGRKENKHKRGDRQSRKTNSGFWKKTGVTTNIMRKRGNHEKIGEKRVLMFYFGKGSKSDWVMHEYLATFSSSVQYTICKVMFKGDEREISASSPSSVNGYEHNHSLIPIVNNSGELITETEGSSFELLHGQEVQIPPQFSGSEEQEETQMDDVWKSYLVDYDDDDDTEQSKIVSVQEDRNEFRPRKPQTGIFSGYSSDDSESDSLSAITTCSIKTSSICDSFGSSNHRIDQLESHSSTIKSTLLTPEVNKTLGIRIDTFEEEEKNPIDDAQEMIKKKRGGYFYGIIQRFINRIKLCSSTSRT